MCKISKIEKVGILIILVYIILNLLYILWAYTVFGNIPIDNKQNTPTELKWQYE